MKMKKVLVTGAAGTLGSLVLKYLLSEGKYEITALDLRTKNSQKKLKKYRRRINIIYGDLNDNVLMDALVKDQDYIIHLAGVLPPLADIKKGLAEKIEFDGTTNMIKAINFYNPDCTLIYASSTTIYGDKETASVKDKPNILDIDYYSKTKYKVENLISKKLKNYIIIRFPLILCNPKYNSFMYNIPRNKKIEAITDNDAAYLLAGTIDKSKELNKKVWNAGGGEPCTSTSNDILANVLSIYGFSFSYLFNLLFIDKNFYGSTYKDSNDLDRIVEFRSDSLSSYYMRLKRNTKNRNIARIFAKPFILFLKRGK